jgi:hypothetical protein
VNREHSKCDKRILTTACGFYVIRNATTMHGKNREEKHRRNEEKQVRKIERRKTSNIIR